MYGSWKREDGPGAIETPKMEVTGAPAEQLALSWLLSQHVRTTHADAAAIVVDTLSWVQYLCGTLPPSDTTALSSSILAECLGQFGALLILTRQTIPCLEIPLG